MATSSVTVARKHYNNASRSFLVRDYASTASFLDQATQSLAPTQPTEGYDALVRGTPARAEVGLRRRLDILIVTFLATVHVAPGLPPLAHSHFSDLLRLSPDELVRSLWHSFVDPETPNPAKADIVTDSRVALVHPSIATSLCLAALKLDQPQLAKAIAEAWIGSTTDDLDRIAWHEAEMIGAGSRWESVMPLDTMSGVSAQGMSGSSILTAAPPTPPDAASEARRQFVKSWIKLVDLLVLHVLPKLQEWDAAGDFVRLQAIENGGWIPDDRIEAMLEKLSQTQQDEVNSAAARAQRNREIEAHKAAHKREARPATKQDKGKGRARDDPSPPSSNGSTPEKKKKRQTHRNGVNGTATKQGSTSSSTSTSSSSSSAVSSTSALSPSLPAPTGFAGLRSSLSQYLSRSAPPPEGSKTATSSTRTSPISTLASYFRHHYATDPLRLLSVICFALALTTYLRRRFSLRRTGSAGGGPRRSLDFGVKNGVALILGKVGETLRMGTKVTTL